MLPCIPGPDPKTFGTLMAVAALGAVGVLAALAALVGWSAHELICLIDGYDGIWSERLRSALDGLFTTVDGLPKQERGIA